MGRRVLVTGAGSGGCNNLIRSLRAGDASLTVLGCHADRFILKKSGADRNYLVPPPGDPRYAEALRRVTDEQGVDLIIPTQDADVSGLMDVPALAMRMFLPQRATVDTCQDKYALTAFLRERAIPAPQTFPVTRLDELETLFERLGSPARAWCRIRTGTGSRGALPVASAEQARSWISYWQTQRGVPVAAFTLCEYLPGRDFLCQSLWKAGRLVLARTYERLSYFDGGNRASGMSSFSALAKTVVEPRVLEVCRRAVQTLDPGADGLFSVDLKVDSRDVPCITEINAGRFFIGMTAFDLVCKHNMAATYVRLALGEPVDLREEYDVAEDYYLVRDLDTLPGVFHADELFEGIEDLA
jgi:carbamoyl-phosphate synthase large subunit